MPVPLIKIEPNRATAQRVAEAHEGILNLFRALAPAVQKAGEDMGRSFAKIRTQHRDGMPS